MPKVKTMRIEALDVFRALTMFLMLFVNDIPSLSGIPHWLLHASSDEDMLGFSDIIFPAFLFAMGIAIPYAIHNRKRQGDSTLKILEHIFWRTLALVIMGIFSVNTGHLDPIETGLTSANFKLLMILAFFLIWCDYPKTEDWKEQLFKSFKIIGIVILLYLYIIYEGINGEDFSTRWWGILGLIGWTYVLSAALYIITRDNIAYNTIALILLITLSILSAFGVFSDVPFIEQIPSQASLYAFGLAGVWSGVFLRKHKTSDNSRTYFITMISIGLISLLAAIICHQFWIISKIQATPTWFFYCCAIVFPLFALIYWITDIKGKSTWFKSLKPAGTATLTCYLIPYIWYSMQSIIGLKYPSWMTYGFVGILKSLVFSFIIIGITWIFIKIKLKLKV